MKVLFEQQSSLLINHRLVEVAPKIYALVVPDSYERAMIFCRAQEYYESQFKEINGREFCMFEYMNLYRKSVGKEYFSYPEDWVGYNVPSDQLETCLREVEEWNRTAYDFEMQSVIWHIRKHQRFGKFYLLGVDSLDSWIMSHEMAHAMFFTDPEYKKEMLELLVQIPSSVIDKVNSHLIDEGYADSVLADEAHAYLATGLNNKMAKIRGIKTWAKKFSTTFKKYSGKYLNNGKVKLKTTEAIR